MTGLLHAPPKRSVLSKIGAVLLPPAVLRCQPLAHSALGLLPTAGTTWCEAAGGCKTDASVRLQQHLLLASNKVPQTSWCDGAAAHPPCIPTSPVLPLASGLDVSQLA